MCVLVNFLLFVKYHRMKLFVYLHHLACWGLLHIFLPVVDWYTCKRVFFFLSLLYLLFGFYISIIMFRLNFLYYYNYRPWYWIGQWNMCFIYIILLIFYSSELWRVSMYLKSVSDDLLFPMCNIHMMCIIYFIYFLYNYYSRIDLFKCRILCACCMYVLYKACFQFNFVMTPLYFLHKF